MRIRYIVNNNTLRSIYTWEQGTQVSISNILEIDLEIRKNWK